MGEGEHMNKMVLIILVLALAWSGPVSGQDELPIVKAYREALGDYTIVGGVSVGKFKIGDFVREPTVEATIRKLVKEYGLTSIISRQFTPFHITWHTPEQDYGVANVWIDQPFEFYFCPDKEPAKGKLYAVLTYQAFPN